MVLMRRSRKAATSLARAFELVGRLAPIRDLRTVLDRAAEIASGLVGGETVYVGLCHLDKPEALKCEGAYGPVVDRPYSRRRSGGKLIGLTAWVFGHNRPLRIANVHDAREVRRKCPDAAWTYADRDRFPGERRPMLAVPLRSAGDRRLAVGVLRVDSRRRRGPFTKTNEQLLEALASQLSLVLDLRTAGCFFPSRDFLDLIRRFSSRPSKKPMTVLYLDLRGFTTFANQVLEGAPEQIVETLNCFFRVIVPAIYQFGGTIDKYEGDGLIALFNAYSKCVEHEAQAVRCAVAIRQAFADEFGSRFLDMLHSEFGREVQSGDLRRLGLKIGLATGEMVVGTVGASEFPRRSGARDSRLELTVIGQDMNLGARLVGDVARELDSRGTKRKDRSLILASFSTWHLASRIARGRPHSVTFRGAGPHGTERRKVYEIVDLRS